MSKVCGELSEKQRALVEEKLRKVEELKKELNEKNKKLPAILHGQERHHPTSSLIETIRSFGNGELSTEIKKKDTTKDSKSAIRLSTSLLKSIEGRDEIPMYCSWKDVSPVVYDASEFESRRLVVSSKNKLAERSSVYKPTTEDMCMFGQYPVSDHMDLVICDHCNQSIRAPGFAQHIDICPVLHPYSNSRYAEIGIKGSRYDKRKFSSVSEDDSSSKKTKLSWYGHCGNLIEEDSIGASEEGTLFKGESKLDRICGVLRNGIICNNPLSCDTCPNSLKRAVPGRSKPFDFLLSLQLSEKVDDDSGAFRKTDESVPWAPCTDFFNQNELVSEDHSFEDIDREKSRSFFRSVVSNINYVYTGEEPCPLAVKSFRAKLAGLNSFTFQRFAEDVRNIFYTYVLTRTPSEEEIGALNSKKLAEAETKSTSKATVMKNSKKSVNGRKMPPPTAKTTILSKVSGTKKGPTVGTPKSKGKKEKTQSTSEVVKEYLSTLDESSSPKKKNSSKKNVASKAKSTVKAKVTKKDLVKASAEAKGKEKKTKKTLKKAAGGKNESASDRKTSASSEFFELLDQIEMSRKTNASGSTPKKVKTKNDISKARGNTSKKKSSSSIVL
eukprot:Nk52_evm66s1020 gene=Nk52_evmTU66s1020